MNRRLKRGAFYLFVWTPMWVVARVLPVRVIDSWLDRRQR